jgi:hypothetical protein
LIHVRLNVLFISWVTLLETIGIEESWKHHASIVEDENQKEIRKLMKEYYVSALSSIIIKNLVSKQWFKEDRIQGDFRFRRNLLQSNKLGDDKYYKIEGVGSISFRLEYGAMVHVNEVLYVPGLKNNLLSVVTLEDKGYWVIFKDRKDTYVG